MSKLCPLIGGDCLQDKCMWWTDFAVARMGDPENVPGERRWDCSINWSAIFQYSSNYRLLGNQAAIESFRNDIADKSEKMMRLAIVRQERPSCDDPVRALIDAGD